MDEWILIPNWDRYQHYKDRDPTWIKVYTELMHRDEWLHLALSERGLLVCLWLEFALRHGHLRTSDIPSCVHQKVPRRSLDSLQEAGFIELSASKPLALTRARALVQIREEKELPLTPPEVGNNFFEEATPRAKGTNPRVQGTNPRATEKRDKEQQHQQLLDEAHRVAAGWNGGDSLVFDETLDELEREHGLPLTFFERDRLWEAAFQHRTAAVALDEDELF